MAPTPENDTSGGSSLMGTAMLQSAIDGLTNAIEGLEDKIGSVLNTPTPFNRGQAPIGSAGSGSGAVNSYSIDGNQVSAGPTSNGASLWQGPANTMNAMAGGGNGSTGGSGSIGGGTTLNAMSAGGNGGWAGFGLPTTMGDAVNQIGTSLMSAGSSALPQQISMSQYIQQQSLMAGYNTTNYALRGPQGFATLNTLAVNNQDRAQGNALINQASGSVLGNNQRGTAMYNAAAMIGYANPGLSWTSSAQTAAGLYSNTSSRMLQNYLGVGSLNMSANGQPSTANNMFQIAQAYFQREFGKTRGISANALSANLGPNGPGSAFINMIAGQAGWNGQETQAFVNSLYAANDVQNKYKNMSTSQMEGLFAGAAKKNSGDIAMLRNAGVLPSDIQTLKTSSALTSQRQGEEYSGFNSGLTEAADLLNNFNQALNSFLNGPLGKYIATGIGYAQGAGAAGSMSSTISGVIQAAGRKGGAAANTNTSASNTSGTNNKSVASNAVSGAAVSAVHAAESQLGVPYVWGGEQPGVGFDCSGLVQWAYSQAGVKLPRTSQEQWAYLQKNHSVPTNQVREGDLVFMAGSDGTLSAPGHVGLMVSDSMLIQAPYTGADVSLLKYSPDQWQHAGRPTGPGTTGMGTTSSGSGAAPSGVGMGNAGAMGGYTEGGSMGSTDELSALAGAIDGSVPGGGGLLNGLSPGGTQSNAGGTGGSVTTSGPYPNKTGALIPENAQAIANFLKSKGANKVAIAGILGNIEQESGGNPTAGSNPPGAGLIQILGDPGGSLQSELQKTWQYIQQNGGIGPVNAAKTAAEAATIFCDKYERPGIPDLSNRIASANASYAAGYARGTSNAAPGMAIVGESGPELVKFKGGEKVVPNSMTNGLLASANIVTPGNNSVGLNLTVNFNQGSIQTTLQNKSDVSHAASEISRQIADYLAQEELIQQIAAGAN